MASFRSKIAAALVAAAAAGTLAGCTGSPGTALIVDGVSYSEGDIASVISEWTELTNNEPGQLEVITTLAQASVLISFAEGQMEIDLSDEAMAEQLTYFNESYGNELTLGDLSDSTVQVLRAVYANSALASATITEDDYQVYEQLLADTDVEVNPRYGSYAEGAVQAVSTLGDVMSDADWYSLFMDSESEDGGTDTEDAGSEN